MRTLTRDITLLLTLIALLFGAASCGKKGGSGKPSNVDYYTCTMHPSVKSQDPNAKCPICSMSLVPVKKRASVEATNGQSVGASERQSVEGGHDQLHGQPESITPHDFTVPTARQQQIGVT